MTFSIFVYHFIVLLCVCLCSLALHNVLCTLLALHNVLCTLLARYRVRPLLKKRTLDPNDPASYRPISNLSFVSKVIEKVVDDRLTDHVHKHHLLPVFQSAYRPFHSTETAIACILNDMIGAVDQGQGL